MNIHSVLQDAARKWPAETALAGAARGLSYGELAAAAGALADELGAAGVRPGDKLGLMFPNGPELAAAFFAAARLEAIVVPVSPALKAPEVAELAREMALDGFCCDAVFHSSVPGRGECRCVSIAGAPALFHTADLGPTPPEERARLRAAGAAMIRFSSGTTSAAKGIVVSHATLFERMEAQSADLPLIPGETILWLQPLTMAFAGNLYVFLSRGARLVIAGAVDMAQLAALLGRYPVTQIYAPPISYRMMLNDEALFSGGLDGVKHLISTSAPLPDPTAEAFRRRFGREVLQYYGLGECARASANWSEDPQKRGSIGKPAGGYEFRLEGAPDAPGAAVGELLLSGPGLLDAYYKPWRPRAEILEDGWFRTGDVARRDADGYYWIVGRTKDVINVGGVKVFPYQMEEILAGHPAVEEALVYGAPEPRFGEVPRAKVKLRPGAACGEKDLLQYANAGLSVFKWLRGVEFVDEIPRTVTGKPRRWTP